MQNEIFGRHVLLGSLSFIPFPMYRVSEKPCFGNCFHTVKNGRSARHESVVESGCIILRIINLGSMRKRVFS